MLNFHESSAMWSSGKRYPDYGYKVSTDNQFYDIFARIWGWDGRRAAPEKAVRQLGELVSSGVKPTEGELKFFLGIAYLSGWIACKKPEAKAARLFEKAADSPGPGRMRGCMALGYFYERGLGGYPKDPDAMLYWYDKAAKLEYPPAEYRLAVIELVSRGPKPSSTRLLQYAAKAGHEAAEELLVRLKDKESWQQENLKDYLGIDPASAIWDFLPTDRRASFVEEDAEDIQSNPKGDVDRIKDDLIRELSAQIREMEEQLIQLRQEISEMMETVSISDKEIEESFLARVFQDDWRKPKGLCEESCDALVDARTLMRIGDKLGIKNYAGIVITAVSSLEIETRRRFFDLYIDFLKAQGKEESQYPPSLLYHRDRDGNLYYTLGSFWHIIKDVSNPDLDKFLREKLLSEEAKDMAATMRYWYLGEMIRYYEFPNLGKTFSEIVNEIKDQYRNEAAHGHSMSREQAEMCCSMLGIMDSRQAHMHMSKIEGALQALLWLTAPLDEV